MLGEQLGEVRETRRCWASSASVPECAEAVLGMQYRVHYVGDAVTDAHTVP